MGKLIAGTPIWTAVCAVICTAVCTGATATAAPASKVAVDAPQDQGPQAQQIYLRETQKVTARAQLIYKLADDVPAAEGRAELVERSQGLVVYEPAAAPAADPQVRPASPVRTTTTSTVSWTPAPALPTPRSF